MRPPPALNLALDLIAAGGPLLSQSLPLSPLLSALLCCSVVVEHYNIIILSETAEESLHLWRMFSYLQRFW